MRLDSLRRLGVLAVLTLGVSTAGLRAEAPPEPAGAADTDAREPADAAATANAGDAAEAAAGDAAPPAAAAAASATAPTELPSFGAEVLAHELALRLISLKQREDAVWLREQSLAEVESEGQRIVEDVTALRAAIDARLAEIEKGDAERIARIAKVYSAMPPEGAGRLLEALPVDVAARVVAKMKQKNAAAILAAIESPVALRISKNVLDPLQLSDGRPRTEKQP